jgi:Uma2 family endonuclease
MAIRTARSNVIDYPDSDGKPVGESDDHRDLMFTLIYTLQNLLSSVTAYVAGNLFIYYQEGDPKKVICPDVFVVPGVPQRKRRIYKTWEHNGIVPSFVIELTSRKTRREDQGKKRELYAWLGVREYVMFDPLGDYLKPPLQAFTLTSDGYIRLAGPPVISQVLGVELRAEGRDLRLYTLDGQRLNNPYDEAALARRESEARRAEAEARRAEARRAEAEAAARLIETRRAEAEAEARRVAEAEVERLRAEIERLRATG